MTEDKTKQTPPTRKFLVGINNGWFSDRYANDIGYNQYSDGRLWNIPYTNVFPISTLVNQIQIHHDH